jgi:hypothetical protein
MAKRQKNLAVGILLIFVALFLVSGCSKSNDSSRIDDSNKLQPDEKMSFVQPNTVGGQNTPQNNADSSIGAANQQGAKDTGTLNNQQDKLSNSNTQTTVTTQSNTSSSGDVKDERLAVLKAAAAYFESRGSGKVALEPPYGNPQRREVGVGIKEMGSNTALIAIGEWNTGDAGLYYFKRNTSGEWVYDRPLEY